MVHLRFYSEEIGFGSLLQQAHDQFENNGTVIHLAMLRITIHAGPRTEY